MSDNELRRMRGIGTGSLAYLREALGVRVDFHVEARLRRVARRPWSQAEDGVLRSSITRGKHARTIGAEMMNLSAEAIEANGSRAEGEGKATMPGRFAARPCTQADDDTMRALVLAGASTRAIAHQLDRTIAAVGSRAKRANIGLKKVKKKRLQMGRR
jgi:hypothetical protein